MPDQSYPLPFIWGVLYCHISYGGAAKWVGTPTNKLCGWYDSGNYNAS